MKRGASFMLSTALLFGAATALADDRVFRDAAQLADIGDEEKRVWADSVDSDTALRKADRILQDAEATAYLQRVLDRLFPEFKGTLRVAILNAPQLNAFALPNGSLYLNEGLIARIENEAQLAAILAHEGAHFTHRHGHKQNQNVKSASAFALGMAMLGVPIVGSVMAVSSAFGYSRELETEADVQAFDRLARAGYEVREAPRTFEHLLREITEYEIKEPFFFASHPAMRDRIESFNSLIAKHGAAGGEVGDTAFMRHTAQLRVHSIESDLAANRYKSVFAVLENPLLVKSYPAHYQYYLGEACRQRNGGGDTERAEAHYLAAAAAAPGFAPAQRALGVLYLRQSNYKKALPYLAKYLELAPNAADAGYVRGYLEQAKKGAEA